MQIEECYARMHGDYEDVIGRLLKKERVEKYLLKFTDESESYKNLFEAIEKGDYEVAFRESHSLKGMCLNLGLKELATSASAVCEEFRACCKPNKDISELLDKLKKDYAEVISNVSEYKVQNGL